jgi:S-adenosylmethionine hydrolase
MTRPITFLSDYGYEDEFAGVCRAVIARIAPEATVIDLTHAIPRHDVRRGAAALERALPFTPPGVHLAVVDPGVGTHRRPLAVRVREEDRVLVGPDNGLLSPAISRLGGAVEVADLTRSPFRLLPVSATFHGRDVFAPVAARLALGAPLSEAGAAIGVETVFRAPVPQPQVEPGRLVGHAVHIDGFGNVTLDLRPQHLVDGAPADPAGRAVAGRTEPGAPDRKESAAAAPDLGAPLIVEVGGFEHRATLASTFADVDEGALLLYEDSSGRLALAVNRGHAGEALGVEPGEDVLIKPPGPGG